MSKKIQHLIFSAMIIFGLAGQVALPSYALAACGGGSGSSKDQVLGGVGATGKECKSSAIPTAVGKIVSLLSYIAGAVAVIMIIISGFNYITSAGDSNKVNSAKNTLIYAAVGLTIAVLAQVIVNLVINTAVKSAATAYSVEQLLL